MNSATFEITAGWSRTAAMPPGRVLRAYATEAKYETMRMLRTPAFSFPFLGLPLLLFLLFAVVLFSDSIRNEPDAPRFVFTAFAVFGMMGPGMFGFGMALALEREQGLLKLKRALPMPRAAHLVAKMLMALLFGVFVMITMLPFASLGHVHLGFAKSLNVGLICVLGTLPFSAVGLLIGSLASGKAAAAYVNILYQLMMHLSGLFYMLPKFLRLIAPVWPTFHLQQLVLGATGAPARGSVLVHVAVLAGLTVFCSYFAVRRLARVG